MFKLAISVPEMLFEMHYSFGAYPRERYDYSRTALWQMWSEGESVIHVAPLCSPRMRKSRQQLTPVPSSRHKARSYTSL
jgi:hypothetical protein